MDLFGIFRRRSDGRNARCKKCYAAYLRRCYRNNPEPYRRKSRRRRELTYVPAKCKVCNQHHPNGVHPKTKEEKFWSFVKKTKCCWLWTGTKMKSGHATFNFGGRYPVGKSSLANRASWEINVGKIPAGKCVLHKCDTASCVKPSHLYIGTYKENSRDYFSRGRFIKGCCI